MAKLESYVRQDGDRPRETDSELATKTSRYRDLEQGSLKLPLSKLPGGRSRSASEKAVPGVIRTPDYVHDCKNLIFIWRLQNIHHGILYSLAPQINNKLHAKIK